MSGKYNKKDGFLSIDEILAKNGIKQRELVNDIEKEEQLQNRGDLKQIKKSIEDEISRDITSTKVAKENFINEIKNGLGNKIKENPNQVKIKEVKLKDKIKNFFIKLFTKF